jgi:hypothetical protein
VFGGTDGLRPQRIQSTRRVMPAAGSHCPYQILAEEFEKLAQSWLRLAEDAERGECIGSPVRMRTVQEYFD